MADKELRAPKAGKKNIRPGQPVVAQKVYFYERPNGEVFECRLKEAAQVHTKYKQVGVSDGTTSARIINDLQKSYKKLSMKQMQTEIRRAWSEELSTAKGHLETPLPDNIATLGDNNLSNYLKGRIRI